VSHEWPLFEGTLQERRKSHHESCYEMQHHFYHAKFNNCKAKTLNTLLQIQFTKKIYLRTTEMGTLI